MNVTDQAQRYLNSIPPAISGSGGHNQTFSVAMALVEGFALSTAEAQSLMTEYSQRCDPPWTEREIQHKLEDAERKADPAKRGKLIRKGVRYKISSAPSSPASKPSSKQRPEPKAKRYEVSDAIEMPDPSPDGARRFIREAFQEGEGIRIAVARNGEDGRELPKDAGITLSREEWLRKLDQHDGNPNGFLKTSERNGLFVSINPMRIGGSRDADVTCYRHALLEFDNISPHEQWGIVTASRIPCTAVIFSGRKSIHAWVKVDAVDRRTFDERVKVLYQHFAEYSPDEKNKNPSRFSRLPNCERGASRQELLALNIGCESFAEWLTLNEVDSLGKAITPDDLDAFDPSIDQNNLLGNRWLCRGMACLLVGPSGIGKSSLNLQMAVSWAIAIAAFGIVPVQPLKSLVIQAENDTGDLSEMFKGVCEGLKIEPLSEEWERLRGNLVFIRDNSHTGFEFCESVRRLIERHKPDIVWLDPILSFVGADLSRQEVIGQFFRNWLNPILDATGAACFCIHHTGKPPSDKDARRGWQTSDYAYAGLGSSDLTNWARAVMVLQDRGQGLFELKLAKRGKRAGVLAEDGVSLTTSLWLRHSSNPQLIFWETSKAPEESEASGKGRKGGKPNEVDRIASSNLHSFLAGCNSDGEGKLAIARRLESWLAKNNEDLSTKTCGRIIERMVNNKKLAKVEGVYVKGTEA